MDFAKWRLDHVWLLFRQQREVNAVRRQLADEVAAAIIAQCGDRDTYDRACHLRVSRMIDQTIWPKYHPRFRGDYEPAFPVVTQAAAVRAFLLVWKRAQQITTTILSKHDPELLAALRELAEEQDNG